MCLTVHKLWSIIDTRPFEWIKLDTQTKHPERNSGVNFFVIRFTRSIYWAVFHSDKVTPLLVWAHGVTLSDFYLISGAPSEVSFLTMTCHCPALIIYKESDFSLIPGNFTSLSNFPRFSQIFQSDFDLFILSCEFYEYLHSFSTTDRPANKVSSTRFSTILLIISGSNGWKRQKSLRCQSHPKCQSNPRWRYR